MLLIGGFIKLGTWGNFNCRFEVWSSMLSFDGIKLIVVFVVFEMEVIVVVMMLGGAGVLILLVVTLFELIILYV